MSEETGTPAPQQPRHKWKFYRMGGLDQALVETGEDLAHLAELDQKLWVALSCPVKGLELDPRTLELLDLDKDGRVRAPRSPTGRSKANRQAPWSSARAPRRDTRRSRRCG